MAKINRETLRVLIIKVGSIQAIAHLTGHSWKTIKIMISDDAELIRLYESQRHLHGPKRQNVDFMRV